MGFRCPCSFHHQGEVVSVGENGTDMGLNWKGAVGAANHGSMEGIIWQPTLGIQP